MLDPVTGYRKGQRVMSLTPCVSGRRTFEAVIESVVVPQKGRRFMVIRDDRGGCHHRWFDEVEAIDSEPAAAPPAKVDRGPVRTGTFAELIAERGIPPKQWEICPTTGVAIRKTAQA